MRYVVILLLGILLGGGAAVYFLGVPPARSAPGQAIKPPDQSGAQPGAVVIALEQSFIDAVLATTFNGLGTPTFQLGQSREIPMRMDHAIFQSGCTNTITLLQEGSGVKTGVQFRNGNVYAPMAFTGSYNLAGSCMQFKGWAQNKIRLSFDQEKQTVYGYVDVEGVNLEGVNPIANNFVTVFVQGAINQKVNPLVLVSEPQLSLMIPVKASNGAVRARAKDVRAEILDGSLKLYLTYEFSGVKGQGT
ncbi:MAG TPA: hypothetical protein VGQ41_10605 [Pyrinomonadaceae bacterium]|jgi:hypothetical protein|nr:hypothetical protein [Pyrinomonadaceae bacterium]